VRNTVDLKTVTYADTVGAAALSGVWRDATFDPKTPAVYYARAIEIPAPRWNTNHDRIKVKLGIVSYCATFGGQFSRRLDI
jgi:hypothetical protein